MGRGPSIEARKNASDAKRGKIFTKIIREIGVAARGGGGDPNNNPRLRVAVDKGLAVNMSKDVIERAIKKATGELEGVDYEEVRYEGYAPGGVAVIVDCLTDNRVRTVADVRHAFSKCGGNMGTDNSNRVCRNGNDLPPLEILVDYGDGSGGNTWTRGNMLELWSHVYTRPGKYNIAVHSMSRTTYSTY